MTGTETSNVQQNTQSKKQSVLKNKVHIKTAPVQAPPPIATTASVIETNVPQSALIVKEVPVIREQSASSPVETPKPTPPTDTELLVKLITDMALVKARLDTLELQLADVKEHRADARADMAKRPRTQIKDNTTGRVFKSKNATYQALLREGALKELVEVGLFGDDPKGNNFGWFALNRALPGRFEEVILETSATSTPTSEAKA